MKKLFVILGVCVAVSAEAGIWKNLDDAHYYSGKKLTEADLAGKVVLVDCWGVNCPPCRALLPRMQAIWASFSSKPFMVVGSHCQGNKPEEVAALVAANKITYPMYQNFGHVKEPEFSGIPFLYVVNHRGKIVYSGNSERDATEALVTAIGYVGQPPDLTPGVSFRSPKYKALAKKLKLGNPIKADIKKLQDDVKKLGKIKKPTTPQSQQLAEAREILEAIETGKEDCRQEIDSLKTSKPEEALKTMKAYVKSFPDEKGDFEEAITELEAKLKEQKGQAK